MCVLAACAELPAPPPGAAFAVATATDGATVTLHDGPGQCVGAARHAVWASADRARSVPGCWILHGDAVLVSFLDGERGDIAVGHLRRVATL